MDKSRASRRVSPYKPQKPIYSNVFYFDWLPQEMYDKIINQLSGNDAYKLTSVYPRPSNKAPLMYDFSADLKNTNIGVFTEMRRVYISYRRHYRECLCNLAYEQDTVLCYECAQSMPLVLTVFVKDPLLKVQPFDIAEEIDVYFKLLSKCEICDTQYSCNVCLFKNDLIDYAQIHGLPSYCYVYTL